MTKHGTSTLTLSGNSTYTGGTNVSGGTLNLTHNNAAGTGAITFTAPGLTLGIADGVNIPNPINLSNAATLQVIIGAATHSGNISGTGALSTFGSVTLTGNNTYTGGTTVTDGDLTVNINSLPFAGGIFTSNSFLTFSQDFDGTYSGDISGFAELIKKGSGTVTLTGANTLMNPQLIEEGRLVVNTNSLSALTIVDISSGAELEFNQNFEGTYPALIGGEGKLFKTGTWAVTPTGFSSYVGGTTISAGRLVVNTNSLPAPVGVVNNAELEFNQTFDGTYAGVISGTGTVVKTGGGRLTLDQTNTHSGETRIQAGTLAVSTPANLGTGPVTLDGGLLGILGSSIAADTDIPNTLTFTSNGGGFNILDPMHTFNYNPALTHAGPFIKSGSGKLVLTSNNTHSGLATITDGELNLFRPDNAQGVGGHVQVGDGIGDPESALLTQVATENIPNDKEVSILSDGRWNVTTEKVRNLWGTGTIHITDNLTVGGSTNTHVLESTLQGPGGLTMDGSGGSPLSLTGSDPNTHTGLTLVTGGLVLIGKYDDGVDAMGGDLQIGDGIGTPESAALLQLSADQIPDTSDVTIQSDGLWALQHHETVDAISGTGVIRLDDIILTIGAGNGSGDLGGTIEEYESATGSLVKTGTGTQTLSGANTYSGNTTVAEGTLLLTNTTGSATGFAPVIVQSGATLAGTGSAAGPVAIEDGGFLTPGTSPGIFTVDNS